MRKETDIALAIGRCGFFRSSMDLLFQEVEGAVKAKKTVVILTGSKENSKKMREMLRDLGPFNKGAVSEADWGLLLRRQNPPSPPATPPLSKGGKITHANIIISERHPICRFRMLRFQFTRYLRIRNI